MDLLDAVAALVGMPMGDRPVPVLCLACSSSNPYRAERCEGCGRELPAFPPYLHSNHICQLQLALAAYEEEALPREGLLTAYAAFAELALREPEWTPDFFPARDSLHAALEHLDRWAEEGGDAHLAPVDELLTDFFQLACGSCAELLHHHEEAATPAGGPLFDTVE